MLPDKPRIVCNSRHWAAMVWLRETYPGVEIQHRAGVLEDHLDPDTALITSYPLHLPAAAGAHANIEYRSRPPKDPTPEDMHKHGAHLVHYRSTRSEHPQAPETYRDFVAWFRSCPIQDRVTMLADLVQRFG